MDFLENLTENESVLVKKRQAGIGSGSCGLCVLMKNKRYKSGSIYKSGESYCHLQAAKVAKVAEE